MSAASRIWVTLAGGVTTVVLARVLGPGGWGTYAVAQSLLAILLAATTLGVEHGIAYFVSSGRWAARAAFDSAVKVSIVVGATGAALGLGVRLTVPSAFAGLSVWLTAVVVAGLPFALAIAYTSYLALATDRYEASTSMPALQATLALALAVSGAAVYGVKGAVLGTSIAVVVVAIGAVSWGARGFSRTGETERGHLRRAISFGVKGYAANALQLVNYRLDFFVLASVASAAVVGSYALAVSLTTLLWLLPSALSDVLYPRVARLTGDGDEATREMVETKSVRHVSLAVLVTALGMVAALELLFVPVFGAGYRRAVNLGLILIPGAAALGVASVLAATVVGRGKATYSLAGSLVSTPLTVALYATLIPRLHATGAALASTLSYVFGFTLMCWFYRRVTGRRVAPLLVPTRSEFNDLRALVSSPLNWWEGYADDD